MKLVKKKLCWFFLLASNEPRKIMFMALSKKNCQKGGGEVGQGVNWKCFGWKISFSTSSQNIFVRWKKLVLAILILGRLQKDCSIRFYRPERGTIGLAYFLSSMLFVHKGFFLLFNFCDWIQSYWLLHAKRYLMNSLFWGPLSSGVSVLWKCCLWCHMDFVRW